MQYNQPTYMYMYLRELFTIQQSSQPSGVNHGGTGRDCPLQSFDWGTAVLTVPPKFTLRRDTAGYCFVRSHKKYITYYNFESAIVKLQFPLCILTRCGSRGSWAPSQNHLKKLKSVILLFFNHCVECVHTCIMYVCTDTCMHNTYIYRDIHTLMHAYIHA